jgi:2'-5' RNA ligase
MRLFFALWPPTEAAEQLSAIARSVAKRFGGKPTRQETIHLTLAFMGDVPEDQLPRLIQSVQALHTAPFELGLDCLGYWQHNHLLWAGTASTCVALGELVENLQMALIESGFAFAGRERIFTPHITLVRKLPEPGLPVPLPAIDTISWRCSSFALVRSQLSDAGSYYQNISSFSLHP